MTKDEIYKLLDTPICGLANCHSPRVFSIVLEKRENGSLLRVFYAAFGHDMAKLLRPDGNFIVGPHNHNKDLHFTTLFGEVMQVDVVESVWSKPMYRREFKSALTGNDFELGLPRGFHMNIDIRPIDGIFMNTSMIHTVLVPSNDGAWLVNEGEPRGCRKYIWSMKEELTISSEGLYIPLNDEDLRMIAKRIQRRMDK